MTEAQVETVMIDVIKYLAEKDELGRWRELEQEINQAWKEEYGASKITVMSAHTLSTAAKTKLEKLANGAELQTLVDDRLMGGAVVRIDERRLDGSVLGALSRLKQTLLV